MQLRDNVLNTQQKLVMMQRVTKTLGGQRWLCCTAPKPRPHLMEQ
jgi:hypothetical protein